MQLKIMGRTPRAFLDVLINTSMLYDELFYWEKSNSKNKSINIVKFFSNIHWKIT